MSDQHARVVESFQTAFGVQHDARAAARLYAEDATLWDPLTPGVIRGRKAIEENLASYLRAFPDAGIVVRNVFGAGDWFTAEMTFSGTNSGPLELEPGRTIPPTGKRAETLVCWVVRLTPDGLCAEDRTYYDVFGFLRQLGLAGA
jgi:hypothetical protein